MKHNHSIILALFSVMFGILAGCGTLPPRLQESGLNSRFAFSNDVPFHEYIQETRQMIEKARVDINETNREVILNANAPFELKPEKNKYLRNRHGRYERGILLLHGLSDSPYFMQAVARHFQEKGFLVRAILLPGHGTVPGDLLQVTYQEWIRATEYGVRQMKAHVENLYMGGFSMGGTLCVHQALHDEDIKGLVLFAPAVGIKSPWAPMGDFLNLFTNWLDGAGDDKDYAKYESFAVNAGAQLYHLTREIDSGFAAGKHLSMPVFAVFSADDISADSDKIVRVFKTRVSSAKSVLILYRKGDARDDKNVDRRIIYKNSHFPEEGIVDFSHVSILMPPDDPHYGKNGGYKYCLHYQGDREKRMACLHDPNIRQGEITEENLKRFLLRRLTYNPRYDDMMGIMDRFLETSYETRSP